MLKWISETESLPPIAQPVFLMHPRQHDPLWDICVAMILVQYEGVCPSPVPKGSAWPSTYYWSVGGRQNASFYLVTGNSWWASCNNINLPPGAEHDKDREFDFIRQPEMVWIGQSR